MNVHEIEAIDVHAHYGTFCREGDNYELINRFLSEGPERVVERARLANTCLTIVSPSRALFPRFHGDPVGGNEEAEQVVTEYPELRQWVVIDPFCPETYNQAERILQQPTCVGIKIHPEEHGYPIKEQGQAMFEFAAKHRAIVLTHTGGENSLPEDFVPFANDFPEIQLILAHIGCTIDNDLGHQVRAVQQSKHGNMFTDTSSAQSIMPGLIEWAVKEIGAERILYGSDSPVYFAPMQRTRIDQAEIDDADKKRILRDNAVTLFKMTI